MVQFFGILAPDSGVARVAAEAPRKVDFFGAGVADRDGWTLSRAEQDACFLTDRSPEPAAVDRQPMERLVRFHVPYWL